MKVGAGAGAKTNSFGSATLVEIYWMEEAGEEATGRERWNKNVKSCENLFSTLKQTASSRR